MVTNVERFFTYLGFSDKSINSEQILNLIALASKEHKFFYGYQDLFSLMNVVINWYIECMEENLFKVITEQEIMEIL